MNRLQRWKHFLEISLSTLSYDQTKVSLVKFTVMCDKKQLLSTYPSRTYHQEATLVVNLVVISSLPKRSRDHNLQSWEGAAWVGSQIRSVTKDNIRTGIRLENIAGIAMTIWQGVRENMQVKEPQVQKPLQRRKTANKDDNLPAPGSHGWFVTFLVLFSMTVFSDIFM